MKIRGYKLIALIKKDFKMLMCNKNTVFIALLPILFAFIYRIIFADLASKNPVLSSFVVVMCSVMNLAVVPVTVLSMMVAEEKEKNTMRTLMLCDVSSFEFLISKALVVLGIIEVCALMIFVITGTAFEYLIGYLLLTMLTSMSLMFFGAIIGLIAKDQMETGTIGAPVMMLFMLPPLMGNLNETIRMLSIVVPTTGYQNLMVELFSGQSLFASNLWINYLVIVLWVILSAFLFRSIFKKKGLDN